MRCPTAAGSRSGSTSVEGQDGQRRAKLRVADTGSGMDAETAARAFEPFFTTKPVGEGTGLGLAVVHGIVQALGGRIRLRTAPGQGSVFAITLPCIRREAADPAAPASGDPGWAAAGPCSWSSRTTRRPRRWADPACRRLPRNAACRICRTRSRPSPLLARPPSVAATLSLAGLSGGELTAAMHLRAPGLGLILLAPVPRRRRRSPPPRPRARRSSPSRCCAASWPRPLPGSWPSRGVLCRRRSAERLRAQRPIAQHSKYCYEKRGQVGRTLYLHAKKAQIDRRGVDQHIVEGLRLGDDGLVDAVGRGDAHGVRHAGVLSAVTISTGAPNAGPPLEKVFLNRRARIASLPLTSR